MTRPETPLARAERHVREATERIARQAAVVEGFEIAGDSRGVERAGEVLTLMRATLTMAHLCVLVELAGPRDGPERPGPARG